MAGIGKLTCFSYQNARPRKTSIALPTLESAGQLTSRRLLRNVRKQDLLETAGLIARASSLKQILFSDIRTSRREPRTPNRSISRKIRERFIAAKPRTAQLGLH
jgi:hypothetical protein